MLNKNFERSKETSLEKIDEMIKKIEEKTKLTRKHLYTILATSFFLIWFGIFELYLSYLLTIYFQVIWSLKAIDSKEIDGGKQWLAYWIIFSLFSILDMFSFYILKIIPFYFVIRTAILLLLSLPGFKGALGVYNLFLVEMIRISHWLKMIDGKKKGRENTIKAEIEGIYEDIDEKNRDIVFPTMEIKNSKKNN